MPRIDPGGRWNRSKFAAYVVCSPSQASKISLPWKPKPFETISLAGFFSRLFVRKAIVFHSSFFSLYSLIPFSLVDPIPLSLSLTLSNTHTTIRVFQLYFSTSFYFPHLWNSALWQTFILQLSHKAFYLNLNYLASFCFHVFLFPFSH